MLRILLFQLPSCHFIQNLPLQAAAKGLQNGMGGGRKSKKVKGKKDTKEPEAEGTA